jgi:small subunit ribosomal protein S21
MSFHNPSEIGICVIPRPGEDFETVIRKFKRKVIKSGILKELRKKSYYTKPSVRNKRKRDEALKRFFREKEKDLNRVIKHKKIKEEISKLKERKDLKNEKNRSY